jgi:hypothetical protein
LDRHKVCPYAIQEQTIPYPQFGPVLPGEQPFHIPQINDGKFRRTLRLPVEQIGHGGHGVELELLVGVELNLHCASFFRRTLAVIFFAARSKSLS